MAEIPPPPENPFGNTEPEDFSTGSTLDQGAPNVASKPGKALLVVGVVGGLILVLAYSLFFSGPKEKEQKAPTPRTITKAPPEPPKPPPIVEPIITPQAPPIPLSPVPVPPPTNIPLLKPEEDSAANAQAQARLRSNMMVQGGGGGSSGLPSFGGSTTPPPSTDVNSQFEASLTSSTTAPQVKAQRIGNLRRTIAQGRIIQATMESALNTELPAPIRAIVSRDVYGEAGTSPLIPKGSRLIGSYNTNIAGGQSRVFVVWTRVIRPDGVDVMLGSPLVDQIGQAGIGGQVDTKFQQIFSRSLLASVINIAFAIGSNEIAGGETTTSTTTSGTSQTTGDAASTATTNALNRLGATTDQFMQRFINARTTILVDQGTKVNVFVNRDLIFPEDTVGARVIY